MFPKEVYSNRRKHLKEIIKEGILLFPGNSEVAYNYSANTYYFRQDSSFSYFFGLNQPDLVGMIDVDNDREILFGNDVSLDDIIWMGPQPLMKDRAAEVGVSSVFPLDSLQEYISTAKKKGRKIHFLPPYRAKTVLFLEELLGILHSQIPQNTSEKLIRAVIRLRSVKDQYEIKEIEQMVDVAYAMHTTVMKMAKPGKVEAELAGTIEGIAAMGGGTIAFPIILSRHGETLHNHVHHNVLKAGDLVVTDAGAESPFLYASDITRTTPVGGKFSTRQKEIYNIVLKAETSTIERVKPGVRYFDIHLAAAKTIVQGLKDVGLMKGNMDDAVREGAHALFFPHGIGHMLGMDVHDMEGLGEDFVGYDEETKRMDQFGTSSLRLGKRLQPGFVFTDEPGIYFIPALIEQWNKEKKCASFINYPKVLEYIGFGGIRIEDDLLVTETGCRVLGKPIPKTIKEVEQMARS